MKKRIVWILTALLMLLAVPLHAVADDTIYSQGYLLYKIEDGGVTIVRYVGDDEETVIVPNMIANYPVSRIAAGAFDECPQVKTIYLPDTIMEIEEGAIPYGIHVIRDYNLVTDHPDPSASPIVPAPTGQVVNPGDNSGVIIIDETLLNPEQGGEETITDEDLPSADPSAGETPAPTDEPSETPGAVSTPEPVAEASKQPAGDKTQPVSGETVEPVSGETEQPNKPLTWLWILLGVVAVGGAAGAAVLIRRKKKA